MSAKADNAVAITVDGERYLIRLSDLTAIDAGDFRRAVGTSLVSVMSEGSADLDVIAGLVWLARRKRERGLKYEDVARRLTYDTSVEVAEPAGEEGAGDHDPEA